MHKTIISVARPYFIRNGRPTRFVRKLQSSEQGKLLVNVLFNYYVNHCERMDTCGWTLNTNINIEDYRWHPADTFLDNLRKAGL